MWLVKRTPKKQGYCAGLSRSDSVRMLFLSILSRCYSHKILRCRFLCNRECNTRARTLLSGKVQRSHHRRGNNNCSANELQRSLALPPGGCGGRRWECELSYSQALFVTGHRLVSSTVCNPSICINRNSLTLECAASASDTLARICGRTLRPVAVLPLFVQRSLH